MHTYILPDSDLSANGKDRVSRDVWLCSEHVVVLNDVLSFTTTAHAKWATNLLGNSSLLSLHICVCLLFPSFASCCLNMWMRPIVTRHFGMSQRTFLLANSANGAIQPKKKRRKKNESNETSDCTWSGKIPKRIRNTIPSINITI